MSLSWPYHFVSLSKEEIQRRRNALDLRGYYAQLSALAVIAAISLYRLYHKGHLTRRTPTKRSWWDLPPFQGWAETRKQYSIVLLWLVFLLGLSLWNTGDDYLHLTKALAHVSLSQLPFQMLLAPNPFIFPSNPALPSLLSSLTSIPQTALAPYHRLFGRLIIVPLLCGHGILYLLFYVQSAHPVFGTLLAKRLRDRDVQCGLVGLATALLVVIFGRSTLWRLRSLQWPSLSSVDARRQVFYIGHLALVTALLALAYAHVVYARPFVIEAVGVSMANSVYCWLLVETRRT
ncbi:hypothetical protein VTN77DRAFT_66 [Rasamsonia byssochlamydoides]|uniref:uncharacterized protein n=1 Tax=Rasamsonia byssochlamydoides TaxID=89139 RepID=UPI0037434231